MAGNPLASLPGLPQRPSLARSSASETRLTQPGIEAARSRKLNSAPTAAFRFKGQFVGDVGYASGKHRQMTLRHNTVSPVEPTELRPAPGSFLNPIERVTYRPSRTPSFAQPIDANRYFDGPSLQPEGRRSGGLNDESCASFLFKRRWPVGLVCPGCG